MTEENKNFGEDFKEKAEEFSNDARTVLNDSKNVAIIAHITIIGWIIAFIMNNNNKSAYGSFYIRQVLGLMLCAILLSFVPVIGWFVNIGVFVLWLISLVGSMSGEMKPIPLFGDLFQDWFKSL
ncbi:DUF4870 domain-containing protein [Xanthomarina sp. GH4-25]|uniref:DUF4870 domain-containing protein n=1 Tax=Xanthomarina sp. GH4-25 TaxID=3349335 RepID=UPI000D685379|nr:hypothetical protein DI383_09735 [Flavobacteriaceae bacterium LYZ1037]